MRLTARGRIVASAALGLWAYALATDARVAAFCAVLLSAAFAVALVVLLSPTLTVERHVPRDRYVEGEVVEETLTLRLARPRRVRARMTESATAGLSCLESAGAPIQLVRGQPIEIRLPWTAQSWGKKSLGPLKLAVHDPFGLVEAEHECPGTFEIIVRPGVHSLGKYKAKASRAEHAAGSYSVSRPGDGREFFGLREYMPGDSIRRINWKASARAGEPIVNQVDRESFGKVTVFIDLRAKETLGDEASCPAVQNGRAAASILAHHDRARDHLTTVAIGDDARRLSLRNNPRLGDLLDALAEAKLGGHADVRTAVLQTMDRIRPRSPVYFCTSGVLDDDLGPAVGLVVGMGARAIVIAPERVGLGDPALDQLALSSRDEALASVRSSGGRVIVSGDPARLGVELAEPS